jgi:hypothetical protein
VLSGGLRRLLLLLLPPPRPKRCHGHPPRELPSLRGFGGGGLVRLHQQAHHVCTGGARARGGGGEGRDASRRRHLPGGGGGAGMRRPPRARQRPQLGQGGGEDTTGIFVGRLMMVALLDVRQLELLSSGAPHRVLAGGPERALLSRVVQHGGCAQRGPLLPQISERHHSG